MTSAARWNSVFALPWAATIAIALLPTHLHGADSIADPWLRNVLIEQGYQKTGHHDAKWNNDAVAALDALAVMWSTGMSPTGDEQDTTYFACRRARKAGCDDAMVLYAQARDHEDRKLKPDTFLPQYEKAASTITATAYHPYLQWVVLLRSAQVKATDGEGYKPDKVEARRLLDQALSLAPNVFSDQSVPRSEIIDAFRDLGEVAVAVENDRKRSFDIAEAALSAARDDDKSTLETVRCLFWTAYAWDARGTGFADTVTDEGWKLLEERLERAAKAGELAWQLDPTNHDVAIAMLDVELGQHKGMHRFRAWFDRAVKTNPRDLLAHQCMLGYLEPKWHGSIEEVLEFGRECAKRGNWETLEPLMLIEAHWTASKYFGDRKVHSAYFASGDPRIWEEIQSVYEPLLKRVPNSLYHRTRYARFAVWCKQWKIAEEQFALMGDKFSYRVYSNSAVYKKVRDQVAQNVTRN